MLSLVTPPVTRNTTRSSLRPNVFRRPIVDDATRAQSGPVDYFQTKSMPGVESSSGAQTGIILPKIIGGSPVDTATRYPYFIHFAADDDATTCGGSLIHEDIILTAASCLSAQTADPYIGSVEWKGGTKLTVSQQLMHPEFDELSLANDIMLVKLDAPRTEALVTLATTSRPSVGDSLRVMGFGIFNDTEFSSKLLESNLSVLEFDECADSYSKFLNENTQICAGGPVTSATGSCFDDKGGPLVDTDEDIQYGIFSLIVSCRPGSPQIYTDVTQYIEFIEAAICGLSSNPPSNCDVPTQTESTTPSSTPVVLSTQPTVLPSTQPSIVPTLFPSPSPITRNTNRSPLRPHAFLGPTVEDASDPFQPKTLLPSTKPSILPNLTRFPSSITKNTNRSPLQPNVFLSPTVEDASDNPSDQPNYLQANYESDFEFDTQTGIIILPKIIGGLPVDTATNYPYFVQFAADDDTTCGGSLIYADIILTAASCNAAQIANPYIGSVEWKEGTELNVIQRLPHPDFDEESLANDIMLVKIDAPRKEALVTLATTSRPAVGEPLRVMGFGLFNDTEFSSELLETEIEVLDFIECASTFSVFLDENTQICAGSVTAATGSCFDDEGGPLVDIEEDIQYGIFSLTESCRSGSPQIYTDVTRYIDFIEAAICDLSSNPPSNCGVPTPTDTMTPFPTWSDPPVDPPTRPTYFPSRQQPTEPKNNRSSKNRSKRSGKSRRSRSGKNTSSGKAGSRKSNKSEGSKKGQTDKSNKRGNSYSETNSRMNNKTILEWLKVPPKQGKVQNHQSHSSRSQSKRRPPTTKSTYHQSTISTKPERNIKAGKR